jgi:ANTAR domain
MPAPPPITRVSADRRMKLWTRMVEQAAGLPVALDHIGALTIAVAGVDATAVVVVLAATPRESVFASNKIAADMEELAMTLGEGPGVDALAGNGPALAGDLTDAYSEARWPAFASAAVDGGVRAIFALPLQVGGIMLGVLDLYRAVPGDLEPEQLADCLVLADTACALMLDTTTRDGGYRPEEAGLQHPEVHQATGMLIAQMNVTAAVALVRLRAYAYSHEQRLRDVAADVVARRLRFHPDLDDADI